MFKMGKVAQRIKPDLKNWKTQVNFPLQTSERNEALIIP